MSHAIMFDTHKYIKKAQRAGFTEQQAEFQAEELAHLIDDKLACKSDIEDLKKEMQALSERLTYQLTIRLGSMLIVAVGVLSILIGIFHK